MVQTLTCRDEIIVLTKPIIIVKDWITMLRKASEKPEFDSRIGHHVKKGKRGAC